MSKVPGTCAIQEEQKILMASFRDRKLECADCGNTFIFTAGEQEFYQERGFSEPRRCPSCRAMRKSDRSGGDRLTGSRSAPASERRGGKERPFRQMYAAVCAACGQPTQVPFEPRADRPVYCKDCYQNLKNK